MTKRFLGTGNLLLREVRGSSTSERFSNWIARIQQSRSPAFPVIDTYSGGHWSVVRSLNNSFVASRGSARLWVVSAGYGLISAADKIVPYGATFAPGQPDSIVVDSVGSSSESSETWWRLLSQWMPPHFKGDAPRSVANVVSKNPDAANLLVLSPDYFKALRADLCHALKIIPDPHNLIILSSDERSAGELAANTVRVDARLQLHLGGARSSFRDPYRPGRSSIAGWQTRHGKFIPVGDAEPCSQSRRCPSLRSSAAVQRTGFEVSEYRAFTECVPCLLPSARTIPQSGRACERKRFQKLFASVKEQRASVLFAKNEGSA